jgi:GNAT superfamily N-acetyltransferase
MTFRDLVSEDVPTVFDVRSATIENPFSRDGLYSVGITEESVEAMLSGTYRGWVCEEDGQVVGFSMADGATGELWVLAVLPEYEGKGIGTKLLATAEGWLRDRGWKEAWLWTSIDQSLRAHRLYSKHGWVNFKTHGEQLYMKKTLGETES